MSDSTKSQPKMTPYLTPMAMRPPQAPSTTTSPNRALLPTSQPDPYLSLFLNPASHHHSSTILLPTPSSTRSAVSAATERLSMHSLASTISTSQAPQTSNMAAGTSTTPQTPQEPTRPFLDEYAYPDSSSFSGATVPTEIESPTSSPPRKRPRVSQTGDTIAEPWLCYLCFRRLVGRSSVERHLREVHHLGNIDKGRIKLLSELLQEGKTVEQFEEVAWGCLNPLKSNYWGVKDEETGEVLKARMRSGRGSAIRNANVELESLRWRLKMEEMSPGCVAGGEVVSPRHGIEEGINMGANVKTTREVTMGAGSLAVVAQAALEVCESVDTGAEMDTRTAMAARHHPPKASVPTTGSRGKNSKHQQMMQSCKPALPPNVHLEQDMRTALLKSQEARIEELKAMIALQDQPVLGKVGQGKKQEGPSSTPPSQQQLWLAEAREQKRAERPKATRRPYSNVRSAMGGTPRGKKVEEWKAMQASEGRPALVQMSEENIMEMPRTPEKGQWVAGLPQHKKIKEQKTVQGPNRASIGFPGDFDEARMIALLLEEIARQ